MASVKEKLDSDFLGWIGNFPDLRAKRGEQPTHLNNDGVRLARGAPRGDPRGKADPGAALGTPEREPRDPHLVSLSAPIEEEEKKN